MYMYVCINYNYRIIHTCIIHVHTCGSYTVYMYVNKMSPYSNSTCTCSSTVSIV